MKTRARRLRGSSGHTATATFSETSSRLSEGMVDVATLIFLDAPELGCLLVCGMDFPLQRALVPT